MLLGMYTIIALAFVSFFLVSNPTTHFLPIGSYTNPVNKVRISRRPKIKEHQFQCFLSELRLAIAIECLSNQGLWHAFLYILTVKTIILYFSPLSIRIQYIPPQHTLPAIQNSLQQHYRSPS